MIFEQLLIFFITLTYGKNSKPIEQIWSYLYYVY